MTTSLPCRSMRAALVILCLAPVAAAAQSIAIKTVPIPHGEQFLLFPSANLGAGGLHIAASDRLLDPFINPALGARIQGAWFSTHPTFYGSNDDMVAGRSLPLSVVAGGERWFGSVMVAMQQVEDPSRDRWGWIPMPEQTDQVLLGNEPGNSYFHGSLGRRLGGGRTAVGASVYYADLGAVDGVNRLYARSVGIDQAGDLSEVRLGLLHELTGARTLEATVSRSLLDMSHHVLYVDWGWDEQTGMPWTRQWEEDNRDRTETWGTRLRYTAPLQGEDTRFGVVLAANTKDHPKIPNYEVVNIPRDPGNSAVFGIGAGIEKRDGANTLGAEVLLSPGRSHTWAFADTIVDLPSGAKLQPGDKTVDNRFRYANWSMRVGFDHEAERYGAQLGLGFTNYAYRLEQKNFLRETERTTREGWMEWAPSWGAMYRLGTFELRYSGRFVAKGFPDSDLFFFGARDEAIAVPGSIDFVVAPTDPVDMPDFRVTTHRFGVTVPLGR